MSENNFSEKLKSLRKEKKLTLKELASLSGTSDSYLSQLENGKRNPPKPELLKKISKGLSNSKKDEALIYAQLTVAAGYDIDNEALTNAVMGSLDDSIIDKLKSVIETMEGKAFANVVLSLYLTTKNNSSTNAILFGLINEYDELRTSDNELENEANIIKYTMALINSLKEQK